ncbi:ferredoxin--NADP reductase [Mycobacteroides salmoniphilum]|uniref:3-ketosteroid-9-alpha-hydroxylase reductase subunit n=1 Tax=Mycobacteroides salmoniphilum TaxID=404941 RepID=A0A4R8SAJ4_9MYCO|nr:ferredoxin--NADP reductase [Mycobacteroides salmoniphilum]TDZ91475.1 3-ketosteroid-9-alpha-hydroxylase reductase subunit [Mycobacteroides salmoniphilum]TEA00905.1 3-ketosteroid-9-alpha-hydroxylase reductase subunit [Mycobacteroides salmoniphilum]
MNSRSHQLTVSEVIKETSDAISLVFQVPESLRHRFEYSPGQFLTLQIPSERTGSVARCYSLSTSPHCDDQPAVTVKRTHRGYASNWICDNVAVGTVVTVLEPSGTFIPRSLDHDVALLAAGSGITPIMSIVKSILAVGTGSAALLYANRDSSSVIFEGQLNELLSKYPGRLTVWHWLEEERGLPTAEVIIDMLGPYVDREIYLCGPSGFGTVAQAAAEHLQIPSQQIRHEEYRSLDTNPFEQLSSLPVESPRDGDTAIAEIEFEGQTYIFDWPRNQPLLDALLAEGLDPPYVCRESACGTCVCSVKSGRTRMLLNESLIDDELDAGLTLACQTLPESDRVHITFDQ